MGSALGPHPFQEIVHDFQSVIGRSQTRVSNGALPNAVLCTVWEADRTLASFILLLRMPLLPCMGQKLLELG